MKPVPHGEPYAGKLHVRFDEGYPQSRRRVAKRCTSRGAGVPDNKGRPALLYTLGLNRCYHLISRVAHRVLEWGKRRIERVAPL